MLHILLLILKIIGIILAVILGIIILLLGIILFVPIRYEISAKCDGTIDSLRAKVKATWILHLLRADVFVKGKKLKWQLRAAWMKKTSAMILGGREDEKHNEGKDKEAQEAEEAVNEDETAETAAECAEDGQKAEQLESSSECVSKENYDKREDISDADEKSSDEKQKKSVSEKVKEKIEKIRTSINEMVLKKEKICDLLTQEAHVRAFKKLKKELGVLLKRLRPKKVQMKLRFGFEDPGVTGKVLGGFSMIYPFLGDTTEIIPDFENKILKGNVYITGRIRICHFAALALKLLLCKDIRTSYKDIKNFKL